MTTTHFLHITRRMLAAIGGSAMLVLAAAPALAAPGGGGTPITCNSISPTSGTVGVPVIYAVSTSGGKGGKSYAWTFSGPASPTTSTNSSPSVTYSAAGTFGVSVHVTDRSGECTANANVNDSGRDQQSADSEQRQLRRHRRTDAQRRRPGRARQ